MLAQVTARPQKPDAQICADIHSFDHNYNHFLFISSGLTPKDTWFIKSFYLENEPNNHFSFFFLTKLITLKEFLK